MICRRQPVPGQPRDAGLTVPSASLHRSVTPVNVSVLGVDICVHVCLLLFSPLYTSALDLELWKQANIHHAFFSFHKLFVYEGRLSGSVG